MKEINPEISARVSILEVKSENVEKTLEKLGANLSENYKVTIQIKERLDKQNGALPHLVDDVQDLKEVQSKMFNSLIQHVILDAENRTKLNILWGVIATIGVAVVGLVIKLLY